MAETFTFEDGSGTCLKDVSQLDTMVTVVDGANFLTDYREAASLQEKGESLGPQDERSVSNLLIDQIEFCDVLILNKMDLVEESPGKEKLLMEIMSKLNPRAKIIKSTKGQVPLKEILNTGLFSFEQAQQAPGWLKEMRGEHTPETEEYGISSMTFKSNRPFHSERFWNFLNNDWMSGIVRSKGIFWLATRMDTGGSWSQAGGQVNITCAGGWMASAFEKAIKDGKLDPKNLPPGLPDEMKSQLFDNEYGDRRQLLVFIGIKLKKDEVEKKLRECLVTDEEYAAGPDVWKTWTDPFPEWIGKAPNPSHDHSHDEKKGDESVTEVHTESMTMDRS